ncbi:hemerythrin-like metal-binding domain protein [Paraburkholderia diazotrophica]|uniref:Hemerythrin-like metal-binding domain protein n=2 Tax=Paraburkholderia diazotrophica TaxID=667676 RepID=A0A1H6VSF2_9BURK|nr:hemerythrin-like metal-binding domain protein [Paraburkholderia diazotrophica]
MSTSAMQCAPVLPPDLQLGEPITDATHSEFIRLLDVADNAIDESLIASLDAWIAHTKEHFAQEESWMEALDFGPRHCHAGQHRHVLHVADMVRAEIADNGRVDLGRRLLSELRVWFAHHVKTMDAMMVGYMQEHGFPQAA